MYRGDVEGAHPPAGRYRSGMTVLPRIGFRVPRRAIPLALSLLVVVTAACGQSNAAAQPRAGAKVSTATAVADSLLAIRADQGRIEGPESAMWVVMISDFQCPYCKQWHDQSMAAFRRDYITPGKVRFAYLHLPLTSIHPHALAEAEASMCAAAQGKFWPFAEALFASQGVVKEMNDPTALFTRFGRELALDMPTFSSCRASPAIKRLVANDMAQANGAGVQSTPSFLIGEFLVQGALPYPTFKKAVDSALVVTRMKRSR